MAKKNQSSPGDSSDGGGNMKRRKPVKDSRKKRKRKYSSSDSSSSEDSGSVSYSDSESDSYSSSSGTSSSSDYRRKRRRKASTKDKYKHQKVKRDGGRGKRDRRHDERSKRKSKWSSESSGDSKSKSTSDSSDSEKVGNKVVAPNSKSLVNKSKASSEVLGGGKSSTPISGKEAALEAPKKDKLTIMDGHEIHGKVEFLGEKREAPTDKNDLGGKSDRSPIRNSGSEDKSSKPRLDMEAKSSPIKNLQGNASQKASAPSELNKLRNSSRSPSPDGGQKRIRKGRGFTKEYSYARRYRTPSPDRYPAYSNRYRARNDERRDQDRYSRYRTFTRRSPPRYNHRSPRGSSPVRFNGRREPRRSISPNPVGHRSRMRDSSRSPRRSRTRSRSPFDERPGMSDRLRSRLGPQGSSRPSGRGRSRSRSPDSSTSKSAKSADAGIPPTKGMRSPKPPSRSRSSSPGVNNGLVSYPDVSPDTIQR